MEFRYESDGAILSLVNEIPSSLAEAFIQIIDNLLIKQIRVKYVDVDYRIMKKIRYMQ
jgi:hypothetical protein